MAFNVRLAFDNDVPELVNIRQAASGDVFTVIHGSGFDQQAREKETAKLMRDLYTPGTTVIVACPAQEPQQICGYAMWRYIDGKGVVPSASSDRAPLFKQKLEEARKAHVKETSFARLSNLFVHPDYQNRGIGRQLMEFGLAIADEKKVPTYTESTPSGMPLYSKYGFKEVSSFDMSSANGNVRFTMLKREVPPSDFKKGHRKQYSFQSDS